MRKKSFKSALTVLLSLMMILVMFPANAFAMDGEGTTADPYIIATADDLYEFAIKVNEGDNTACAVLTADITLIDTNWTPIGNDSNQYKGTFDGDGHTITGLSVDIQSDNTIYAGLFGFLGEGGTIKNLGLADSKITCSGNRVYAGGVCGWNTGTIQNCYNTGDVSGEGTQYVFVGGVCGFNGGTIENCYNTGDVSGTGTRTDASGHAGGVCGCNDYGTIENCYNTGEVSGTGTSTDGAGYDGGVCGRNTGTIENCYNTGEVSGIYGFVYAGGVCGANGNSATIINCYNTGDVSGTSSYGFAYAGGVCGLNDYGTIENCYNTGEVSGTGTSTDGSGYAGGVCGWNTGTIENCYFLFGTGDKAVSINSGTVDNVEEKSAEAFASGEVAWLLNEPQTEKPWGQGSNGLPVLKGNLPDGVTSYVPVRITIVMTDNTQKSYYSAKGSTFTEYPTGYAFFFKDGDTKTWISKGTQTYDADATIYAENMPLEKIQAKAPTCTEDGNSAYWYSAAFDKYFKDENGVNEITAESTVIPAKGHGESEVKGAKEATCTEDGYTGDKVCKVCGEILERGTVIEKLGHVWGEPEWNWSEDGASCKVTFTCQNNSEHKESPNVTVTSEVKTPATCTESGVTTYMATFEFNGEAYTDTKEIADIPATGHNLTNIPAIAPTCTKAGNIEYWYCDTCDKYFCDETATDEIALADTVLEATGHSYENGKCTACGAADPDYKPTESGNENSDSSETDNNTQSPQTGDNSNIALWIAVMLAAGTALTGTVLYSRKRKYSK